jgi:hypothetical protein
MKMALPSIQMFLSHRYKSPEVNLYFFEAFSEKAEIQFDVDAGTMATCVTRLERIIRNVDAFIGIYPYPDPNENAPGVEQKREASRYFRLELDLAVRSRKPALVFYDSRYGHLLECPPSLNAHTFDMREILGAGGKPKRARHRRLFEEFLGEVKAFADYQSARRVEPPLENQVALVFPQPNGVYTPGERRTILSTLQNAGCDILDLPWPPRLTLSFLSQLERADWVVTDIGEPACATGVPAFLHGQFYPLVRLLCTREHDACGLETTLFGGTEVGYPKDILRWRDETSLRTGLEKRIALIKAPATRISTTEQAVQYFRKAALRNDAVFLSYAGADQEIGAVISSELKKRFQTVFDYRDGTSIVTGKPWLDEVFESLAASAIGIPLLSANYVHSENCLHEAREMASRVDQKKILVLPIKIRQEEFELPIWAQSTQYARFWEHQNPAALVEWLVQSFDRNKQLKKRS